MGQPNRSPEYELAPRPVEIDRAYVLDRAQANINAFEGTINASMAAATVMNGIATVA